MSFHPSERADRLMTEYKHASPARNVISCRLVEENIYEIVSLSDNTGLGVVAAKY